MPRTKQQVIDFLESKVGKKVVCVGNLSLNGQCVTLIKSLMEYLGVPEPYKARGHAKTVISAYLNEGIAKPGTGFISVFSNKNMGDGYGHIWCNAGDGDGVYYESNGKKPLLVTKGATYQYDAVCNFDDYVLLGNERNSTPEKKYTEEEMTKVREERDKNWNLFQESKLDKTAVEESLKKTREEFDKFRQDINSKLDLPASALPSDTLGAIERLLSVEDEKNKVTKELGKLKEGYDEEKRRMQEEINKLKQAISDQQRENETLLKRLEGLERQVKAQESTSRFIKWLSGIFSNESKN